MHYQCEAWDQIPKLPCIRMNDKNPEEKRTRRTREYKKLAVKHFLPSIRDRLPNLSGRAATEAWELVRVLEHWRQTMDLPDPQLPNLNAKPDNFDPVVLSSLPVPPSAKFQRNTIPGNNKGTPEKLLSLDSGKTTSENSNKPTKKRRSKRIRDKKASCTQEPHPTSDVAASVPGMYDLTDQNRVVFKNFEFDCPMIDDFDPDSYYVYEDAKPRKLLPC